MMIHHLLYISGLTLLTTSSALVVSPSQGCLLKSLSSSSTLLSSSKQQEEVQASVLEDEEWIRNGLEQASQSKQDANKKQAHIWIYDTTLRDGTQGESVSASCNDKMKIAKQLSEFGVDFVEAGWPGSNPKDQEFFERSKTELTDLSKLTAFGSTRRKNVKVEEDGQIAALLKSEAPTVCIVAKAHKWQVTDILQASEQENLDMILESVQYLKENGRRVFVDLEHFFDGADYDLQYTLQCCQAAINGGADGLVLCDTNGGTMPWQVEAFTKQVCQKFPLTKSGKSTIVGIHAHNDCGLAVANSLTAVKAGATMVQGTMNGIGERTGNADLCSIVPTLALHMNHKLTSNDKLRGLTSLSRYVSEVLNKTPNPSAPYVGLSAFAHKGGLHVAALKRSSKSYQHVDPSLVGNEQRVLISELSGRQNILGQMARAGLEGNRAPDILRRVKELENRGYTFEGAEASVHIMMLHASQSYCPPFTVLDYSAQVFDTNLDPSERRLNFDKEEKSTMLTSRATIKIRTPNTSIDPNAPLFVNHLQVSDGNGPVDALAKALKRALVGTHPSLETVELVDYKVRILDPESATSAATRVLVEFRQGDKTWTTVSVDRNVISASLNAVVDGFEYALVEHAQLCMLCDDEEY